MSKKNLIYDALLALILVALGLIVYFALAAGRESGSLAVVTVMGEAVMEIPLESDGEYSLNGGTNVLVIEGGKAYMKYADCPKKLCVKQGKKFLSGQKIFCSHNKVLIEIVGDGEEIFESQ